MANAYNLAAIQTLEDVKKAIRYEFPEGPTRDLILDFVDVAHLRGKIDGVNELRKLDQLKRMRTPTDRPQ
jgi:hypothetical protein